jgi:hypothetical protein
MEYITKRIVRLPTYPIVSCDTGENISHPITPQRIIILKKAKAISVVSL